MKRCQMPLKLERVVESNKNQYYNQYVERVEIDGLTCKYNFVLCSTISLVFVPSLPPLRHGCTCAKCAAQNHTHYDNRLWCVPQKSPRCYFSSHKLRSLHNAHHIHTRPPLTHIDVMTCYMVPMFIFTLIFISAQVNTSQPWQADQQASAALKCFFSRKCKYAQVHYFGFGGVWQNGKAHIAHTKGNLELWNVLLNHLLTAGWWIEKLKIHYALHADSLHSK